MRQSVVGEVELYFQPKKTYSDLLKGRVHIGQTSFINQFPHPWPLHTMNSEMCDMQMCIAKKVVHDIYLMPFSWVYKSTVIILFPLVLTYVDSANSTWQICNHMMSIQYLLNKYSWNKSLDDSFLATGLTSVWITPGKLGKPWELNSMASPQWFPKSVLSGYLVRKSLGKIIMCPLAFIFTPLEKKTRSIKIMKSYLWDLGVCRSE